MTIVQSDAYLLINFFDGAQFLLQFHASILEPNFDLPLSQAQSMSNFNSPPSCQIVVEVELFFQL